jgi:hypothetical protein
MYLCDSLGCIVSIPLYDVSVRRQAFSYVNDAVSKKISHMVCFSCGGLCVHPCVLTLQGRQCFFGLLYMTSCTIMDHRATIEAPPAD